VGLSLLAPYCALLADGHGRVDAEYSFWAYEKIHAGAQAYFPLKYVAEFEIGGQRFELGGTLTLR